MYKIKVLAPLREHGTFEKLVKLAMEFINKNKLDVVCVQYMTTGFHETWPQVVITYKEK